MNVTLGEICSYGSEKVSASSIRLEDLYISTENMTPNRGGISTASSAPATGNVSRFRRGDTLVSNIRPYFKKIWHANQDGYCSNDVLVFKPNDINASDYLYWLLNDDQFFDYVMATSKGTKMPRGDKSAIMNYVAPSNDKATQLRITSFMNPIQAKIETNTRLNGYLAELQQAIYEHSIDDGESITIGEIAEVIDCLHSKKPERQTEGKPLIQLNNIIDDGILDMSDTFCIAEDDYHKWTSRCEINPGDCVITNVGRIGAVSQAPRKTAAAMGRNMTCIRPSAYPATLITALCSKDMRHEIERHTDAGTIMNALNVRNIPKLEVQLPSIALRDSIEATLKSIQDMRELLLEERRGLAVLRDALLPKLMSGEIDVSEVDLTQLNSHLGNC